MATLIVAPAAKTSKSLRNRIITGFLTKCDSMNAKRRDSYKKTKGWFQVVAGEESGPWAKEHLLHQFEDSERNCWLVGYYYYWSSHTPAVLNRTLARFFHNRTPLRPPNPNSSSKPRTNEAWQKALHRIPRTSKTRDRNQKSLYQISHQLELALHATRSMHTRQG